MILFTELNEAKQGGEKKIKCYQQVLQEVIFIL